MPFFDVFMAFPNYILLVGLLHLKFGVRAHGNWVMIAHAFAGRNRVLKDPFLKDFIRHWVLLVDFCIKNLDLDLIAIGPWVLLQKKDGVLEAFFVF